MIGGVHPDTTALPSHRRFPVLDGYRAIAAFMVLTTHVAFTSGAVLQPVVGPVLSRLDFGVALFFLLSGFLLYRPWALAAMTDRPGPDLRTFYWRRGARILPAYWLMVVFTLALLPEIQPVEATTWPKYLGLWHIYVGDGTIEGLTQVWSLATEVAFYLVLPLLAWLAGRLGRGRPDASARYQFAVLGALAVVALVFNLARTTGPLADRFEANYWLPGFLDWFAVGMAFAVVSARLSLPSPGARFRLVERLSDDVPACLVGAVLVFLIACTPIAGPYLFEQSTPWGAILKHYLFALTAALLLAPGFLGRPLAGSWRTLLAAPVPAYLGRISYGVFLWHLVLLRLLVDVLGIPIFGGQFLLLWALTAAAAVAVASLSWRFLEAPVQRLSHRWPRQQRSSGVPAAR